MARGLSTRQLVLGLLTQQSMSGYDIKRFLKSLGWLIDGPSLGSLYPALHALLEDGLVTVEVVPSQHRPPRKIYTITQAGRQALQELAAQPAVAGASLKDFVTCLILTNSMSHTGLTAHLQQRRSQVATHRDNLEQMIETLDGSKDRGRRLTFGYGLALAMAELAWLDSALEKLSHQPLPLEVVGATPSS
jgi:DNA-binding PadR family transcriptional regulator